jgi:hypothetical protein
VPARRTRRQRRRLGDVAVGVVAVVVVAAFVPIDDITGLERRRVVPRQVDRVAPGRRRRDRATPPSRGRAPPLPVGPAARGHPPRWSAASRGAVRRCRAGSVPAPHPSAARIAAVRRRAGRGPERGPRSSRH